MEHVCAKLLWGRITYPTVTGQLWNGRPSDVMMNAAKAQLERVRSRNKQLIKLCRPTGIVLLFIPPLTELACSWGSCVLFYRGLVLQVTRNMPLFAGYISIAVLCNHFARLRRVTVLLQHKGQPHPHHAICERGNPDSSR